MQDASEHPFEDNNFETHDFEAPAEANKKIRLDGPVKPAVGRNGNKIK
jgi:hypothetical protein